ncbi:MAG: hypothetical protein ABSG43_00105 [Solirubrobacteraceae bacterium]
MILTATNQAGGPESLTIAPAGGAPLASSGPISPQATAQVQVDLSPGTYRVAAGAAATLHVGRPRPSASGALLQP